MIHLYPLPHFLSSLSYFHPPFPSLFFPFFSPSFFFSFSFILLLYTSSSLLFLPFHFPFLSSSFFFFSSLFILSPLSSSHLSPPFLSFSCLTTFPLPRPPC